MALTRCQRRAAQKAKLEKRQRHLEGVAQALRLEHVRKTVAANKRAPKVREYFPKASTLGRLGGEQMGGGAHVFGEHNSRTRTVDLPKPDAALGRTDRARWTSK